VVTLAKTDGQSFTVQLDYPKGDPRNRLTDQEIEEKFAALADGVLSSSAQMRLKDEIWNLERSSSVGKLMALMKADVHAKKIRQTKQAANTKAKNRR